MSQTSAHNQSNQPPRRDNTPAKAPAHPTPPSVARNQSNPRPPETEERRAAWKKASDVVTARFGPLHPSEMMQVLQGLYVLGFTSLRVIKTQGRLFQIPAIEVGNAPSPLAMRYEEQRPILNDLLRKVQVPRRTRIQHFKALKMAPLSIEAIERLGIEKLVKGQPAIRSSLEAAFRESLARAQSQKNLTITAAEGARVRQNIMYAARLEEQVSTFRTNPYAPIGVPIRISAQSGEPVTLTIGEQNAEALTILDLRPDSARHTLFREGRSALQSLGDFLHTRYLNDGAERLLKH
jgi:hypothetical protein